MELYLCNSIDELNLQAELPKEKFKLTKPKLWVSTAEKLFNQAIKLRDGGDREKSYVSFMKYLNIVSLVRKSPEYRREEKYYNELLGAKNVKIAIDNAEALQKQLVKGYRDREEEKSAVEKLAELEIKNQQDQESRAKVIEEKEKTVNSAGLPAPSATNENTLTSWELDTMMKQKSTSFIIFDVRSREAFEHSHMNHINCVSIPEDILKPGLSAASLYKALPLDAKMNWPKRLTVDVIVLVDWFGEKIPGSAIFALEQIMTKWDPSSSYRGVIKTLSRGYDDWLSRFPMQTTNPLAITDTKLSLPVDLSPVFNIEYPDLDEAIKPPVDAASITQPTVNRSTKPSVEINRAEDESLDEALVDSPSSMGFDVPKLPSEEVPDPLMANRTPSIPVVNRNLKQSAMIKYLQDEEKLVERNLAITVERLEQEKEWDRIRSEKEANASKEIASQLQEREGQLLEMLMKMESENKLKEIEIARLRQENHRLGEMPNDRDQLDEEKTIKSRISEKEKKKETLHREVEQLREIRKQAERAREKERQEQEERRKRDEQNKLQEQRKAEDQKREELSKLNMGKIRPPPISNTALRTEKLRDEQPSGTFGLGSKMNRSHSTPDLAQALEKESEQGFKMPKVDRELKPLTPNRSRIISRPEISKNRNLNAVYGSMGRGLTGLKNLGNTCYMNSILQCISNTAVLTNFFTTGNYRRYLNPNNKQARGELADEVSSILNALWSDSYRSVSCKDFKNTFGRHKPAFSGYDQQDSHEFLTILVDWLHEELNEVRVKRPLKEQNNNGIPDEKAAELVWEDYLKSNRSIIVHLFAGQHKSSLLCTSCQKESVMFEPFFNLSLPIPPSKTHCNIRECFDLYTKSEHISGWSCSFCKNNKGVMKKIDIWKLPPVLVVHLKRFYNDGLGRKILTTVDFSVNELDLSSVVKSSQPRYSRFQLYAVSNHYGTMDAGHYTAYCKNPEFNKWFKFDDQNVMEINGNEVRSAAAYILFYTAIDYEAPQVLNGD